MAIGTFREWLREGELNEELLWKEHKSGTSALWELTLDNIEIRLFMNYYGVNDNTRYDFNDIELNFLIFKIENGETGSSFDSIKVNNFKDSIVFLKKHKVGNINITQLKKLIKDKMKKLEPAHQKKIERGDYKNSNKQIDLDGPGRRLVTFNQDEFWK